MTRVNVVDLTLLADQHLLAECRELYHIYSHVERFFNAKKLHLISPAYTLNTGHVKFFSNKVLYVYKRHIEIHEELFRRNVDKKVDFVELKKRFDALPDLCKNDYIPTDKARHINAERIFERVIEKPSWYKFKSKQFIPETIVSERDSIKNFIFNLYL